MDVKTAFFEIHTQGFTDIIDVTQAVQSRVQESGFTEGSATVFVAGSTAGITSIEYEPGLLRDLPAAFEKLAPGDIVYQHNATWGDDNGSAHVRAALLGASFTVPFQGGKLILGTWQQIVVIDFDTRPRRRRIIVQMTGK